MFIAYCAIMELYQIRSFVAVAQSGGFAAAADQMEVAPSSVTRAVAKLEASLGLRLLNRTTRSVTLTEAGEAFLKRILPSLDEIDAAVDIARTGASDLSGTLRVGASVSFGQAVIAPRLSQFSAAHPNLTVDLILSDTVTDIIADRIDIAIRHGALSDSSLIAQRLASVTYRLVASPNYLQRSPAINEPSDLRDHACLTYPYSAFRSSWSFSRNGEDKQVDIQPVARISNAVALAACVRSGMGLALLADWLVDDDLANGSLISVLPEWSCRGAGAESDPSLWIVTPSRSFVPTKTQAFVQFLRASTRT